MPEYPQIEVFMREVIALYGDMTKPENRTRAFPNSGVDDRKLFDGICALYYEKQNAPAPEQKGKKK